MCWHRSPCAAPWQCPDPPEAKNQGWAHTAQMYRSLLELHPGTTCLCCPSTPGLHPCLRDSLPLRPGLPFLPPSTSTPRCSSPCSATNSQNHSCSYKSSRVSWSPPPGCLAAVYIYFTLLSPPLGQKIEAVPWISSQPVLKILPGRIQKWLIYVQPLHNQPNQTNSLPGLQSLPHCPEPLHHCHCLMLNQAPACLGQRIRSAV